jgi:hypothetical protein
VLDFRENSNPVLAHCGMRINMNRNRKLKVLALYVTNFETDDGYVYKSVP